MDRYPRRVRDGLSSTHLEQGIAAVLLLAAFAFELALLVPAVGLVLAADALAGPRGPVPRLWARVVVPRRPGWADPPDPEPARVQAALVTVVLAAATLGFALRLDVLGWLLTLTGAGASVLAATGVVALGPLVARRLGR